MSIFIQSLKFSYPGASHATLDISSMSLESGKITAVIGSNGAGKTTLFKCITGFLKVPTGTIYTDEHSSEPDSSSVSQVFQSEQGFDYINVEEWISFNALLKGYHFSNADIDHVILTSGLSGKSKQKVPTLSGGELRKLNLQCALIGNPRLLILDEPTVGLDQEARLEYWKEVNRYISEFQGSVLFTSHLMDEVERYADYVYAIKDGQVIQEGSPREFISRIDASLIVEVDQNVPIDFSSTDTNMVTVDGKSLLYITDETSFYNSYGSAEKLISLGIHLRKPVMADVYRQLFKERIIS